MKITFLMPCYAWGPSGGFRVVYEYASRLAKRGHRVTVVHPRQLRFIPRERHPYWKIRAAVFRFRESFRTPTVDWMEVNPDVHLLYTATSHFRDIPDGDMIFATAWHTVASVLACPEAKGVRGYLIQGYESWQGPKDDVDRTWRSPLRKVVVSRWLVEKGRQLGVTDVTYIPNGVDCLRYIPSHPIDARLPRVAMMYSTVESKGSAEAITALTAAKRIFPGLEAVAFGICRRPNTLPEWIEYHRNPPQNFLIHHIYGKSSIFISSSWAEGFALPPAEALACGCAVVATDSGGIREFIRDGATGLLSPPKDSSALAKNLLRLLADDSLRIELVRRGLAVIRTFNWERSVTCLEAFIVQSVHNRNTPYMTDWQNSYGSISSAR